MLLIQRIAYNNRLVGDSTVLYYSVIRGCHCHYRRNHHYRYYFSVIIVNRRFLRNAFWTIAPCMLKNLSNLASFDVHLLYCCWFPLIVSIFCNIIMPVSCRHKHSSLDTDIEGNGGYDNNYYSNTIRRLRGRGSSRRMTSVRDLVNGNNIGNNDLRLIRVGEEEDSGSRARRELPPRTDSPFDMPQECYQRYTNSDHHHSLVNWLHHKNASHYSPISPSYHQALLKLQTEELIHGLQVTSGASACNSHRMKVISPSTPLRERAVCQFEYILNYKPNRIPSTFTEVKCSCPRPSGNKVGRRMFECEPLRYQVRVLLFDEQCLTFSEHTETIALACIPVLQATASADDTGDIFIPAQPEPQIPT